MVMFQNSICGTVLSVNIQKYKINRYLYISYSVVKLLIILSLLGLLTLFLEWVNVLTFQYFKVMYIYIISIAIWDFMRKVLLATFNFKKLLALDFIYILSISIQLFIKENISMVDIFIYNTISYLFAIIVVLNVNIFYFHFDFKRSIVFIKRELKSMLHLTTSFTMQWFNSRIGYFVLATVTNGANTIGIINGYISIVGIFNPLLIFLDNYLLPKSSEIYYTKGLLESKKFVINILDKIFIALVFVSVLMVLFRSEIIGYVLGPEYLSHSNIIILLIIINLYTFKLKKYAYLINILNIQYIFSKSHFLIFIYNLLSIYFVVYYFHVYGVVLLLLLNAVLMFVQIKYYTIRELKYA